MMSPKITTLLGSPRRNGNSETLALSFADGAAEAGLKTHSIWINGLKIGGCLDCRRCWSNGTHCFLKDDMRDVYASLDDSDVIVFATPLYFYSWSSQIKPVWDRLLPYFSPNAKISLSGRKAVLLATAEDEAPAFGGLSKSFELACNFAELKIAGEVMVPGVREAGDVSQKQEWLNRAFELGKSL
jgi:multimeric flavodoxin WrbA